MQYSENAEKILTFNEGSSQMRKGKENCQQREDRTKFEQEEERWRAQRKRLFQLLKYANVKLMTFAHWQKLMKLSVPDTLYIRVLKIIANVIRNTVS